MTVGYQNQQQKVHYCTLQHCIEKMPDSSTLSTHTYKDLLSGISHFLKAYYPYNLLRAFLSQAYLVPYFRLVAFPHILSLLDSAIADTIAANALASIATRYQQWMLGRENISLGAPCGIAQLPWIFEELGIRNLIKDDMPLDNCSLKVNNPTYSDGWALAMESFNSELIREEPNREACNNASRRAADHIDAMGTKYVDSSKLQKAYQIRVNTEGGAFEQVKWFYAVVSMWSANETQGRNMQIMSISKSIETPMAQDLIRTIGYKTGLCEETKAGQFVVSDDVDLDLVERIVNDGSFTVDHQQALTQRQLMKHARSAGAEKAAAAETNELSRLDASLKRTQANKIEVDEVIATTVATGVFVDMLDQNLKETDAKIASVESTNSPDLDKVGKALDQINHTQEMLSKAMRMQLTSCSGGTCNELCEVGRMDNGGGMQAMLEHDSPNEEDSTMGPTKALRGRLEEPEVRLERKLMAVLAKAQGPNKEEEDPHACLTGNTDVTSTEGQGNLMAVASVECSGNMTEEERKKINGMCWKFVCGQAGFVNPHNRQNGHPLQMAVVAFRETRQYHASSAQKRIH